MFIELADESKRPTLGRASTALDGHYPQRRKILVGLRLSIERRLR
jgi:hypothetical protein